MIAEAYLDWVLGLPEDAAAPQLMSENDHSCFLKTRLIVQEVRIDFQFDCAAFDLAALPFKIPYPVPFKLLGDETKVCCLLHNLAFLQSRFVLHVHPASFC